jgi:hypothetical protein
MSIALMVQIGLAAFLAWGGVLSLRCLLRDRSWYARAGN